MNDDKIIRILVIDDQESIHEDFRKIIEAKPDDGAINKAAAALFGDEIVKKERSNLYKIDSAHQGEEALEMVKLALAENRPYPLAFVDVRMPPGWDGVETVRRIWQVDPEVLVVLSTAYSDHTWEEIVQRLGRTDHLLILKKPFDNIEVRQIVLAMTKRWNLARHAKMNLNQLKNEVALRTRDLEIRNLDLVKLAEELQAVNQQLAGSRIAAEAANRAKTEFLANMSHEIRTPMTAILGFAEVLREEIAASDNSPQVDECIEAITRNARYLLGIISDVLDMSKIESEKFDLNKKECSPLEIIANSVSTVKTGADEKGLAIDVKFLGDIPKNINTDPIRLQQILINLISNAVKFTSSGGIQILAQIVSAEDHRSMLSISVADTGIGISKDQLKKIFDRFNQADTSSTRQYGGSGLGLAISKRLANILGGDITVDSMPGEGSKFTITVDIGPIAAEASLQDAQKVAPDAPALNLSEKIPSDQRILLTEDSADNQRIISLILTKVGYQVTIAENGQVGYDKAMASLNEGNPYDLILMDMQMPVMDGYAATRRLRSEGYSYPIVALTAHATVGDRKRCLDAGCDYYITKPINRNELLLVAAGCMQQSDAKQLSHKP
jgi:two-component system, sensor histidine kinase and response regulator